MTTQLTNDFLSIAILEAKGILTMPEAIELSEIAEKVVPTSYVAAQEVVKDALMQLDSWCTCEVCRRIMHDWREGLAVHHAAGHPTAVETTG